MSARTVRRPSIDPAHRPHPYHLSKERGEGSDVQGQGGKRRRARNTPGTKSFTG